MRQIFHPRALFSYDGVLTRGDFFRTYTPLFLIVIVSDIFGHFFKNFFLLEWFFWSIFSLCAILICFQVIKRLRDTKHSWWYSLLLFLPIVNLYIIYLLFFKTSKHV